ncbi:BlaI/MecI/CopY family transcriptional regulator [Paenibacillus agilis]|uniref:BlaI/MecI/CopY family transcriptional regulator n=1 Tax=Paenibacillus agilis TaxID=3020863 RepID=A0A559IGR2_9BACL|nr:BlaI/MecI/CopY family transcriptional regulator [Paenibacillus agilis]TVX86831.1 BlaI/MecI/CopY family transcriptional regulator [Paenibacillus agilis]
MKQTPHISDAEWEVMKVLWAGSPRTSAEIIDALAKPKEWSPKTIRTLLSRLVQKEVITFKQESNRSYSYYPLVTEDECVREVTNSLLQRLYGGAIKPLLVNFINERKLSSEDIAELKQLLDEKEKPSSGSSSD